MVHMRRCMLPLTSLPDPWEWLPRMADQTWSAFFGRVILYLTWQVLAPVTLAMRRARRSGRQSCKCIVARETFRMKAVAMARRKRGH